MLSPTDPLDTHQSKKPQSAKRASPPQTARAYTEGRAHKHESHALALSGGTPGPREQMGLLHVRAGG